MGGPTNPACLSSLGPTWGASVKCKPTPTPGGSHRHDDPLDEVLLEVWVGSRQLHLLCPGLLAGTWEGCLDLLEELAVEVGDAVQQRLEGVRGGFGQPVAVGDDEGFEGLAGDVGQELAELVAFQIVQGLPAQQRGKSGRVRSQPGRPVNVQDGRMLDQTVTRTANTCPCA